MKKLAILALLMGMSTAVFAKGHGNVYSPEKGVICDKKSEFCSDSEGISLALTKDILGEKAAKKWQKILDSKDFDSTSYTMSNGLSCDTNKKICKKSKWDEKADKYWTMKLFNKKVEDSHHKGGADMIQMEKDCKMYVVTKTNLPMAAVSVQKGNTDKGVYYIPVSVKWDEPLVDEKGECKIVNGIVKSYGVF